ncbi:hypothetical protein [Zavarzinella formosa]|uniref:hypothetical protein n=1 Tax=Zavarzinella formosa TaxID=360055 RepID=UPI0002DFDAE3|nr:hypothetical protein [Zavarzinella formosa]
MAKTRKKETGPSDTATVTSEDTSFNPQDFDPALQEQAGQIIHAVAESTSVEPERFASQHAPSGNGHAAAVERKPILKAPNPHAIESIAGDENRVRLLKEEPDRKRGFPGAWVIRFEKNPNDMVDDEGVKYSKERPHPVLKMLKDEGFKWGFSNGDGDGKGGWGKGWTEGHYTYAEHVEARRTMEKAAAMIGAKVEQGAGIPD